MAADVASIDWYNEDSAPPLTVTKPAAFGSGQILVAVITSHGGAITDITAPAGWVSQGTLSIGGSPNSLNGKVFTWTFTGSEPATWDFSYFGSADTCLGLFRVTGADTTPTVVVTSTTFASSTSSMDSPTLTPSGSNDLLICLLANTCGGTVLAETDPSGMTDRSQTQVAGNFNALAGASQQLASSSATGVRTWTSVTPTGQQSATMSIAVKSSAAGGATAAPAPLVVTLRPARVPVSTPIVARSTLADPPVLTTRPPLVVSNPTVRPVPPAATIVRSSLFDAATPGPLVVSSPYRPAPVAPPLLTRSSLADAAVASVTTPQPIVVTSPTRTVPTGPAYVGRGTLQDDPVLTTPPPIVVTQPYRPLVPPAPVLSRSSLVDVVTPTAATPPPLVVSQPARPPVTTSLVLRATFVDPPALTTPGPLVITAPTIQPLPTPPTIARSSLFDASTPGPLVVSQPWRPATVGPPTLRRSSLQDLTTPQPLVVVPPPTKAWATQPVIVRSTLADVLTPTAATPPPLVVSRPALQAPVYRAVLCRSSLVDASTEPTRDLELVVGDPEPKWRTGGPAAKWATETPVSKWRSAGPATKWHAGQPDDRWADGPPKI